MVITTLQLTEQALDELRAAVEHGTLTPEQLKLLITYEAAQLDLEYDEAIQAAKFDRLPRTPLGLDIRLLVGMLST